MKKNIVNAKKIIIISILVLFLIIIGGIYYYYNDNNRGLVKEEIDLKINKNEVIDDEIEETVEEIAVDEVKVIEYFVDVKGAVNNPGVYKLSENNIVNDQTTPNMIQKLNLLFARKPLISKGI